MIRWLRYGVRILKLKLVHDLWVHVYAWCSDMKFSVTEQSKSRDLVNRKEREKYHISSIHITGASMGLLKNDVLLVWLCHSSCNKWNLSLNTRQLFMLLLYIGLELCSRSKWRSKWTIGTKVFFLLVSDSCCHIVYPFIQP